MLILLNYNLMQCQEMYTHDTIRNDEEEINKQSDSISFCKKRTG